MEARAGALHVTVTDNGGALAARKPPAEPGYGIVGMRERARSVGGTLEATPHADGFRVTARLPLTARDTTTPPDPAPTGPPAVAEAADPLGPTDPIGSGVPAGSAPTGLPAQAGAADPLGPTDRIGSGVPAGSAPTGPPAPAGAGDLSRSGGPAGAAAPEERAAPAEAADPLGCGEAVGPAGAVPPVVGPATPGVASAPVAGPVRPTTPPPAEAVGPVRPARSESS